MDPKMVSMKMSKREKKRMFGLPVTGNSSGPDYPWGLELRLDDSAIKKLGIGDLPEVGEKCMIHATGKVTRISSSTTDKNSDRNIEIQIMDLVLVDQNDEEKKAFESV